MGWCSTSVCTEFRCTSCSHSHLSWWTMFWKFGWEGGREGLKSMKLITSTKCMLQTSRGMFLFLSRTNNGCGKHIDYGVGISEFTFGGKVWLGSLVAIRNISQMMRKSTNIWCCAEHPDWNTYVWPDIWACIPVPKPGWWNLQDGRDFLVFIETYINICCYIMIDNPTYVLIKPSWSVFWYVWKGLVGISEFTFGGEN